MSDERPPLDAVHALRRGFRVAAGTPKLLVPLVLVQGCAALLELVPAGWVLLACAVAARRGGPDGVFSLILRPSTWALWLAGGVLAMAGASLLRTTIGAGCLGVLARRLSQPGEGAAAFGAMLLEAPARWLAAAGVAAFLEALATVSAAGGFLSAWAYFSLRPGAGAAAAMALATIVACLLPFLFVALRFGVARAVLDEGGPVGAVAAGLSMFGARPLLGVLPLAGFWITEVAIGWGAAVADALLAASVHEPGAWVLMLAPRVLVQVGAAVPVAFVALARQGTVAAIVLDDLGRLPPEAPAPPAAPLPAAPRRPELALVVSRPAPESGPAD